MRSATLVLRAQLRDGLVLVSLRMVGTVFMRSYDYTLTGVPSRKGAWTVAVLVLCDGMPFWRTVPAWMSQ